MAVKKKREKKTSQGLNSGGGRNPHLTPVELVLMGKGQYVSWRGIR